ncbi:MAG: endonuclease III domain-containing protein [Deltaproteobacteria bacterium]
MDNCTQVQLMNIFSLLLAHFGKRNWWPGDTSLEIVFGCILTQNVSWKNVEEAIIKLKEKNLINLEAIINVSDENLGLLLKSTRYYNQKAVNIKSFCSNMLDSFDGNLDNLFSMDIPKLREYLLSLKGIGKETADSIILYAANKPIFVVDAYTKRIFSRLGYFNKDSSYDEVQAFFMKNLLHDVYLFNEFHALIVCLGQSICKNTNPPCSSCILERFCIKKV